MRPIDWITPDPVLRQTCGICDILEEADLVGILGLAFAVMYEMALGQASPFYGYLQSLPSGEHLPIFWSDEELRELRGSDLEAAIVADKAYLLDDYKTHVVPVLDRHPMVFADRSRFTLEHFAQATSLVTSRAFEVDAFHGDSLVPLADLFNHKTAGEHVHFEADSDVCPLCGTNGPCWCDATSTSTEDDYDDDESRPPSLYDPEEWTTASEGSDNQFAASDVHDDSADILEMTVIRKCPAFSEVFNTYGDHSNAALITKYGFAEENNQFDVVSLRMDEIMDEIARSTYGAGYTTRIEFWKEQGRGIVTAVTAAAAEADDVGTKEPNDDSESWADDFSEAASIHSEAREDEQDDFHFSFLGKASPTLLMFLLVLHAPSVLMRTFIKSPQTFQRYVEQVAMGGWRIFSSQPEQIKGASRSEQVHAAGASPLERAVSSTLVSLAKARLQRFPNSLQHDNARLKALVSCCYTHCYVVGVD